MQTRCGRSTTFSTTKRRSRYCTRCSARSRFAADSDDDEGDSDDDDDSEEKLVADEDDGDDDEYEMNQHEYHRESWEQGDSGDEPFRIDDL